MTTPDPIAYIAVRGSDAVIEIGPSNESGPPHACVRLTIYDGELRYAIDLYADDVARLAAELSGRLARAGKEQK